MFAQSTRCCRCGCQALRGAYTRSPVARGANTLALNASGKVTRERAGNNVITNRTYDNLERLRTDWRAKAKVET